MYLINVLHKKKGMPLLLSFQVDMMCKRQAKHIDTNLDKKQFLSVAQEGFPHS